MLGNLKADYELCKVAMKKHLHGKKWYGRAITLDKLLQQAAAVGIIALVLGLYYKYLFPLLGGLWTAIIALSLFVLVLCWAIRAIRYFHEGTVSGLLSQHKTATGLFHRNADIIARLSYEEGQAAQMIYDVGGRADQLDEQTVHDWAKGIIDYLKHYRLDNFISRFSADDATLLKVLPERVPTDHDVLRRERFNARRKLITEFTRELRRQAINSPYGSESDVTPPDKTSASSSTRALTE